MQGKILRVKHKARDLVLEVGELVPSFYAEGMRARLRVLRIDGEDPVVCTLSDGGVFYFGRRSISEIVPFTFVTPAWAREAPCAEEFRSRSRFRKVNEHQKDTRHSSSVLRLF